MGPGGPNEGPPGAAGGASFSDAFAARVRGWYLADRSHPLWETYIKQSGIDLGYYIGGPGPGQWRDDEGNTTDYDQLKADRRATVSINQIKPIVKVLTGMERQTRFDPMVLPQGEEDENDANYMTWLMKYVIKTAHVSEYRSMAFKDQLIPGMGCNCYEIDYTDNPATGDILVGVLKPGRDCIWDPHWTRPDLSDANHFLRWRWAWVDDVIAMHPEKAEKIREAITQLNAILADIPEGKSTDGGRDAYGAVYAHPNDAHAADLMFYDRQLQRVMVVEGWYVEYETVWMVLNKQDGSVQEAPDREGAQALARADKERMEAIRRLKRTIKMGTVLPATEQTLEDPEVIYENDSQAYPFVPVIGERVEDDIRGIVRDLRDPQRVENKRISQALDLVSRWSKIRRRAVEGSVDPATAQTLDDPLSEKTIWYRAGSEPPSWDVPQGLAELSRLLAALAEQMKVSIREISGINTDLLGVKDDTSSGIAIARRQAQGQVIATEYFDNFRWAVEIGNQRLARRIQQKFTRDEYIRLTNDVGAPVVLHLNPVEAKDWADLKPEERKQRRFDLQQAGKPPILGDVSKLKWDLVMSEVPATPTARAQALDTLMQMAERLPAILPILAPTIIKLTDGLPDKHLILQKLEMMLGGGAPPVPGPGGAQIGAPTEGVGGVPNTPGEGMTTVAGPPPGAGAQAGIG